MLTAPDRKAYIEHLSAERIESLEIHEHAMAAAAGFGYGGAGRMNSDLFAGLEIEPREVKQLLDSGEDLLFVDVRETWEHQLCKIDGSRLIPLGQLASNLAAFEAAEEIVLFCHSGRRSLDAAAWLRSQGVLGARSMAGGIDRWSREIDPSVPRY